MREGRRHHPPLVPSRDDVQEGYALPCRSVPVEGSQLRLFTVPGGNQDPARTVLCLPGLGASGRSFAPMRALGRDLRLLLWTPPLSTPARLTPLEFNVQLLSSPPPAVGLPERFELLGSSYGSLLALRFALAHPARVKSLVLVSPVASTRRIRRGAVLAASLLRVPLPFAYLFAPVVARVLGGSRLSAEGRSELVREARRISPLEMVRRLRDIVTTELLPRLPELGMPVLVVHGGRDFIVPLEAARDVALRIPNARFEVIRGAAHLPYMSHPEAFNDRVHDFLLTHRRP